MTVERLGIDPALGTDPAGAVRPNAMAPPDGLRDSPPYTVISLDWYAEADVSAA